MALVPAQLPDDVLAHVLVHLPPRSLAASRSVCKGWRAVIDDRRLLRTDLLPLSLHGFYFIEQLYGGPPQFFADPFKKLGINNVAKLDYVETTYEGVIIENHCNGLLLLFNKVVVNPATRQWVALPPAPPRSAGMKNFCNDMCLAFDPTVSPDYEVLLLPRVPHKLRRRTIYTKKSEWPPSRFPMRVFSSRTWRWEERVFVRRGEAAGTIADIRPYKQLENRYIVYWKGAIYVHYQNDFIMRITLSDGAYEVIESPTGGKLDRFKDLYLGKSSKGVYCTLIYNNMWSQLQVWFLDESSGKMAWTLKKDINFAPLLETFSSINDELEFSLVNNENPVPKWVVQKGNCDEDVKEATVEHKNVEWDFNKGFILEAQDKVNCDFRNTIAGSIYFLGFHPYKEIVFLSMSGLTAVAYDFSSCKVQYLGELLAEWVGDSFPYTPCWTGELFEKQ